MSSKFLQLTDKLSKAAVYQFNAEISPGDTVEIEGLGAAVIMRPAQWALFDHAGHVAVELGRELTKEEFEKYGDFWTENRRAAMVRLNKITF